MALSKLVRSGDLHLRAISGPGCHCREIDDLLISRRKDVLLEGATAVARPKETESEVAEHVSIGATTTCRGLSLQSKSPWFKDPLACIVSHNRWWLHETSCRIR